MTQPAVPLPGYEYAAPQRSSAVQRARVLPPSVPRPEPGPGQDRVPLLGWPRGSKPPRWFRWAVVLTGLALTCGSAIVGARLLEPWRLTSDALQVHDVSVTADPGPLARCPRARVRFVATIETNGRPGELTISWTRPDGSHTSSQRLRVAEGQDSVQAQVGYTFHGPDPWTGRAVVVVDGDDGGMAHGTVRYLCARA